MGRKREFDSLSFSRVRVLLTTLTCEELLLSLEELRQEQRARGTQKFRVL